MGRIKAWVRAFFGFSRTETNAFLILLPLMALLLFSEPLYRWIRTRHPMDRSTDERLLDSLIAHLHWIKKDSAIRTSHVPPALKFIPFDPNTVNLDTLVQLGLPSFVARRVIRFREKGGVFRKKDDLAKIYGLDSMWFLKAKPWISLSSSEIVHSPDIPKKKKILMVEIIDINNADSLQLNSVYGVGPTLSKRIRAFRDRLGGFISLDQLQEVYGLDSAVIKRLKTKFMVSENFAPQKLNLNGATLNELIRHPYINRKAAQAIIAFRLQHGNFHSVDQLVEIKLLTLAWIEKLKPYLVFE